MQRGAYAISAVLDIAAVKGGAGVFQAIADYRRAALRCQLTPKPVVNIDYGSLQRTLEQQRLGGAVRLHITVIIEVIAA